MRQTTTGLALMLALLLPLGCASNAPAPETANANPGVPTNADPVAGPAADTPIDLPAALREIAALEAPADVDAEVFDELKAELGRLLDSGAAASPSDRQASILEPLTLRPQIDRNFRELLWPYYFKGDYDQNGYVNAADLIPLARRFGASINSKPGLQLYLEGSIGYVIDSSRNGVLDIADVTAIGINFGKASPAWEIYGSNELGDYPFESGESNLAALVVAGPEAIEGRVDSQAFYRVPLSGQMLDYYWLQSQAGSSAGIPTELAWTTPLFTQNSSEFPRQYREKRTELNYDPAGNTVSWRHLFAGDTDANGEIYITDLTQIQNFYNQTASEFRMNTSGGNMQMDPDINRDGVVNIADVSALRLLMNTRYSGYALFHTADPEMLPQNPWASERTFALAKRYRPDDRSELLDSAALDFTPASSSWFWIRLLGGDNRYGPVCEMIQIP